jgi:hypothetical protein
MLSKVAGQQPEAHAEVSNNDEDEGEQWRGLYGSQIDSSNLMGSAVAELIGTFILIYTGCAVAVAAIL